MYIYEVLRFSLNLKRMFGSVLWLLCIEELGLWSSSMYIQLFIHTFPTGKRFLHIMFTPCTLTHLESSAVSLRIGQPLGSKKWIKTFIIQKKKNTFCTMLVLRGQHNCLLTKGGQWARLIAGRAVWVRISVYKRRQGLLYIRGKSPGSNVVNSLLLFGDKIEKKTIVDPDLNQIPLRIFKMSGSNGYVLVWSSRVSLIIIFSEKALLRIYSLPVCLLTEGTFD